MSNSSRHKKRESSSGGIDALGLSKLVYLVLWNKLLLLLWSPLVIPPPAIQGFGINATSISSFKRKTSILAEVHFECYRFIGATLSMISSLAALAGSSFSSTFISLITIQSHT